MRFERIVQGSFGGAYLGIIATHVPSIFGSGYRPTQNVELIASIVGLAIAAGICVREHRRDAAERAGSNHGAMPSRSEVPTATK
jgi:hypothetical protein